MRVNKYDQIPQIMTGQLITPAAVVFPGLAAVKRGGGGSLELGIDSVPGSIRTGSRGVASAVEGTTTTLFGFKPKPKSSSNNPLHNIQFLV
jgi:hypothetical protein